MTEQTELPDGWRPWNFDSACCPTCGAVTPRSQVGVHTEFHIEMYRRDAELATIVAQQARLISQLIRRVKTHTEHRRN